MKAMKEYFEEQFRTLAENLYPLKNSLHESVLYSALGAGKRVRASLSLYFCKQFRGNLGDALLPAAAVEMVHAYSLIHDDLPCMDNDDWRRGRPTNHKLYGEAGALLAGDALLTDSFRVLSDPNILYSTLSTEQRLHMICELSSAIGGTGMVLGQALDMQNINHRGLTEKEIDNIHIDKTAKLIGASCAMGAIAANPERKDVELARQFGLDLGLAFQIQDDLLDDQEGTGKSSGKDIEQGKVTFATLLGREGATKRVHALINRAKSSIKPLDPEFEDFIEALLSRRY